MAAKKSKSAPQSRDMSRRSAKRRYYLPDAGKVVEASNAVEATKGVNESEEKSDA